MAASAVITATSLISFTLRRHLPPLSVSLFSTLCRTRPDTPSLSPSPPTPKKVPFTVSLHGYTWQDPYRWMRKTDDPDLVSHLRNENSYAEAFIADTEELQRTLFGEMKRRMPTRICTPPERWGPWLYYQYIPDEKEYPVLCRRFATEKISWLKSAVNYMRGIEGEQILLDWNQIVEQYGYVHVGTCRISPDHNFLAYTVDISGSEKFMLQVKDLRTLKNIPKFSVKGVVSVEWAQDCRTLFYTESDENQRPYRVLAADLRADSSVGVPIFTEADSGYCVDITSTKDGRFITVNSNSRTSSEVYTINATNPHGGLQRLCKRTSGVRYFLEHHLGSFYILTNSLRGSDKESLTGRFYLCRCRVEETQSSNWQIIIVPSEESSITDMDIFNGYLVLYLENDGSSQICSIDMPKDARWKDCAEIDDLAPWYFPVPSNSCTIASGSNHDFMSSVYRAVLSSPVMPDVIVDYDLSKRTFSIVQQEEVFGVPSTNESFPSLSKTNPYEASTWIHLSNVYACEKKEVLSHDNVDVPLTILYSKRAHKGNKSPGILLGYGAYGEVLDKSWCADRLSLLDRGWVVAFADVRGGGGGVDPSWHKSGSGLNKLNSIYDFVSCGKYLVNEGYVHEAKLGAVGQSAGGLLVGAAINMHPELFRAAILKVPFLDICNTLLDPTLPLTILDHEEFGNPQINSHLEYILQYSPCDNITEGVCYPPMLVTASLHDSRVGVWEAAKWVAKVRDNTCLSCSRSVILKTNMSGGHFGEGGRFGQCEEATYEYAFLMKAMGISDQGVLYASK